MPDTVYPFNDNSYTVLHYTKLCFLIDTVPILIDNMTTEIHDYWPIFRLSTTSNSELCNAIPL